MKGTSNKGKFDELIKKLKVLRFSINKNRKKTYVLGAIIGSMIVSGIKFGGDCKDLVDIVEYYNVVNESDEELNNSNNDAIKELLKDNILVADVPSTMEQDYYFKDGYLYDKNNDIVSLEDEERTISFVGCKIDSDVLNNIDLVSSNTKNLCLDYSIFNDDIISYLPSSLECLSLRKCYNITNLNGLGDRCHNIRGINLDGAVSLSDLSFIYELPNLEEVYLSDCPYVTYELLVYLKENNIVTNLTEEDVNNSKTIDGIIEEIILPNMTDSEKVQAICLYILDNFEYDITTLAESNDAPLEYFLKEGKGVCASYAYLSNVLLNKSGVRTYMLVDDSHAWNMVKLDDKYYYVDTTNMDGSLFNKMLLSLFNIASGYMVDPDNAEFGAMSNVSEEEVMITASLLHDVINKNSNKDILEKYGNMLLSGGMSIFSLLYSVMVGLVFLNLRKMINTSKKICYDIYYDYLKGLMIIENKEYVNRLNSFNGFDEKTCFYDMNYEENNYYRDARGRYVYKFNREKMSRIRRIDKIIDK